MRGDGGERPDRDGGAMVAFRVMIMMVAIRVSRGGDGGERPGGRRGAIRPCGLSTRRGECVSGRERERERGWGGGGLAGEKCERSAPQFEDFCESSVP